MKYRTILITGGLGFVGSNIATRLKGIYPEVTVIAFDNMKRVGSELNIARLKKKGVECIRGDVRVKSDLADIGKKIDFIIECSAEPSVLAGTNSSPEYLLDTNLSGTINCLELARKNQSDIIFLSTSRVYPIEAIENLRYRETETRFELEEGQTVVGVSLRGIAENFPLGKVRSLYGATKLCSEFIMQEYIASYGIRGVINRCGVITGPWQMGKIDQGVIVLWMARHYWKDKPLTYIGYGGYGKQVRDFVHVDDVFRALIIQMEDIERYNGEIYNIGGGVENSLSLLEMTHLCQRITGNVLPIYQIAETRQNDVKVYISDTRKFQEASGWCSLKDKEVTFREIYDWIQGNENMLKPILG